MRFLAIGTSMLLFLWPCTPVFAEPKAVLVLTEEQIFSSGPRSAWPTRLRLIAYDNGLIIRRPSVPTDPQDQPRFVWQQRPRSEVLAWVAEVKAAALDKIDLTDRSVSLPVDWNFTTLQYWDRDSTSLGLARLSADGTPCTANDDEARAEETALARQATDPRFLALCDKLMRLSLEGAEIWHPQEMVVTLFAFENQKPDETVPWPDDWPKKFAKVDQTMEICVPVGADPNPITALILDPKFPWLHPSLAVSRSETEQWMIGWGEVVFPGEVLSWFRGPCSADPHFQQ
jgi:hypothetical protein